MRLCATVNRKIALMVDQVADELFAPQAAKRVWVTARLEREDREATIARGSRDAAAIEVHRETVNRYFNDIDQPRVGISKLAEREDNAGVEAFRHPFVQ